MSAKLDQPTARVFGYLAMLFIVFLVMVDEFTTVQDGDRGSTSSKTGLPPSAIALDFQATQASPKVINPIVKSPDFAKAEIDWLVPRLREYHYAYDSGYDYYDLDTLHAMAQLGDAMAHQALARRLAYKNPLAAVEQDFLAIVRGRPQAAMHAARIHRGLANGRFGLLDQPANQGTGDLVEIVARDELINAYAWGLVGQLYGYADNGLVNAGINRLQEFDQQEKAVACDIAREIYEQIESLQEIDPVAQDERESFLSSFDLTGVGQECPAMLSLQKYGCNARDGLPAGATLDGFVCHRIL